MRRTFVIAICALAIAACDDESTAPTTRLRGSWDVIGFTEGPVSAVVEGSATFRSDGTFEVNGTITFPGEPTESISLTGTYDEGDGFVVLTTGGDETEWSLDFSDEDNVVLTRTGPPPVNTITLRRL